MSSTVQSGMTTNNTPGSYEVDGIKELARILVEQAEEELNTKNEGEQVKP
jgi:hypothetical protein